MPVQIGDGSGVRGLGAGSAALAFKMGFRLDLSEGKWHGPRIAELCQMIDPRATRVSEA